MPSTITKVPRHIKFKNVHGNYSERFSAIVRVFNDPSKDDLAAYNEVSEDIKDIIAHAIQKNQPLRACGSLWSMSKVPYVRGIHLFSYNPEDQLDQRIQFFLKKEDVRLNIKHKQLLFCQCGTRVKDIHPFCEMHSQSLQTTGASNGQTIAGAIGTGVHGSAIKVGSIQDTVRGLHLITGPKKEDSIFLQASSHKVVKTAFAKKIHARLISDDELFYSALVGLGACGYVHGVLIETEPIFQIANFIKDATIDQAYAYANTLSSKKAGIHVAGMNESDLYHVKFYINQYDMTTRAEVMYKIGGAKKKIVSIHEIPVFLKYNKDLLLDLGKFFSGIFDGSIPGMINKRLPKDGEKEIGYVSDIFGDTANLRDGQFACAIAVASQHAEKMTRLMIKPFQDRRRKKIPAVFSFRFVPKSKATIAFTKYEMNCLIGIDGIDSPATRKYLKMISQKMIESNIPHTWHWGKTNFMDPTFVNTMFAKEKKAWIRSRRKLLAPKVFQAFSNQYLRDRGL